MLCSPTADPEPENSSVIIGEVRSILLLAIPNSLVGSKLLLTLDHTLTVFFFL